VQIAGVASQGKIPGIIGAAMLQSNDMFPPVAAPIF
jgi:hypothetical protein